MVRTALYLNRQAGYGVAKRQSILQKMWRTRDLKGWNISCFSY